jgi:glycosyltransferase involved in cell wall biosynthesis
MTRADPAEARHPLISIGVPICNEEQFLIESLEALLGQTYPNLELLISDNASTDNSARICADFAARYDNVYFHRFDTNQGAIANFRKVLDDANGDYFMWASGHDLWQPNYIEACYEMMQRWPQAVVAFGSTNWVGTSGEPHSTQSGWTDTRGMHPIARYMAIYWGNMNPILGLTRTDALRGCGLVDSAGADLVVLTQLALLGDFVHADATSWSRREFREEQAYADKLKRYQSDQYGLDRSRLGRLFPLARLPIELLRAVVASPISLGQKLLLLPLLAVNLPIKYVTDKWLRQGRQA